MMTTTDDYRAFLESKFHFSQAFGHEIEQSDINTLLFPHQRDIVQWAVKKGRAAIFASFGLGKSFMQLETLRLLHWKHPGRYLIIAPLGVRQEFKRDAGKLGMEPTFVRTDAEVLDNPGAWLFLTNYESVRDGKLDINLFTGVSLDEASILRSYGSDTYQTFLSIFGDIPYRFVATATPSPNRYKELIHYAGFLGVMDTGQALAQPLDAKVLTPSGWKPMGDIHVGEQVIAADGTPTKVLGVYPQGEKPIFRVTFSDGASTECTEEHLWMTRTQYERNNEARYRKRNGPDAYRCGKFASVKTTSEIAITLTCKSTLSKNHQIPMVDSIRFAERPVTVNPYLMGILLGDGHIRRTSVSFTTVDAFILGTVEDIACKEYGLSVQLIGNNRSDGRESISYSISSGKGKGSGGGRGSFSNPLLNALRDYDLLDKRSWNKRIPSDYLFNCPDVRLDVLRGLMDSDGTIDVENRTISFLTTSPGLAEDVQFLVQSFGGTAIIRERDPHQGEGQIAGRPVQGWRKQYHVSINLPNSINPFRLPRKASLVRRKPKYFPTRYITSVEPVGTKQAQCIAIEHPDHLYVTDDFIVTHNTRFFQRDSTKANNLTLFPHMEAEFFAWLHSWSIFLQRPSDLGYSDEGYELPPLKVVYHEIPARSLSGVFERDGQGQLLRDAAMGLKDAAREKRESIEDRVEKMLQIIDSDPDAHYLLWHDLEAERHAIREALPAVSEVYGTLDLDIREQRVIDFSEGKTQFLSTKPELSGSGCNFQRFCHKAIFLGIGYKFNDFIQSIHRIHRFLQAYPCEIHIIYTETEREVLKALQAKWQQHEEVTANMSEIIRENGLSTTGLEDKMKRTIGVTRRVEKGRMFEAVHNDCVEEVRRMEANSVDLIHTSIPFGNHYEYSASYNDFGHNPDHEAFFQQMDFLTPELLRILQPGRVAAIHVKDRIRFGNVTGYGMPTVEPFHADCIYHYKKHGFVYFGMITVVTDVVRENNQTYRLGWTEQCKDGSKMGVGSPEYVLLFRKLPSDTSTAYADEPVVKSKSDYTRARWQIDAHAFWRSSGDRFLTSEEMSGYGPDVLAKLFTERSMQTIYNHSAHVEIGEALEERKALPSTFMAIAPGSHHPDVWTDVNRMRTLNGDQTQKGLTNHICPLQFDIVDRIITRYSNPGELVFDPFGGLGTVPYRAVKLGRRGKSVELNPEYFEDSLRYLRLAEIEASAPTLFDFEETDVQMTEEVAA